MNDQNIEHPDIRAAERPRARTVTLEMTDEIIRKYIWDEKTEFIEFCMGETAAVDRFLSVMRDDFEDWCQTALAEG